MCPVPPPPCQCLPAPVSVGGRGRLIPDIRQYARRWCHVIKPAVRLSLLCATPDVNTSPSCGITDINYSSMLTTVAISDFYGDIRTAYFASYYTG